MTAPQGPLKPCEWCGQPIPRTKPSAYAVRRFCSQSCAGHAGPPPPPTVPGRDKRHTGPRANSIPERFVALLCTYAPLPLTADDVADELGAARSTVQSAASRLVREGRIERRHVDREALYVAPEGVAA